MHSVGIISWKTRSLCSHTLDNDNNKQQQIEIKIFNSSFYNKKNLN